MKKTYNSDTIRLFQLFSKITSISPIDCFNAGEYVVFIIPKKTAPKAIGKEGKNIRQIKETLEKEVKVMEEADSPEDIIRSFLFPIKAKTVVIVEKDSRKHAEIELLNRGDRRILLNNQQEVLKCMKEILIYFYPDISEIKVL